MPEAEAVGAALLGAAFLGLSALVSDLLANWEPTALSKNPPPATRSSSELEYSLQKHSITQACFDHASVHKAALSKVLCCAWMRFILCMQ